MRQSERKRHRPQIAQEPRERLRARAPTTGAAPALRQAAPRAGAPRQRPARIYHFLTPLTLDSAVDSSLHV